MRTLESTPESQNKLEVLEIGVTSVKVSWLPPQHPNGLIKYYQVYDTLRICFISCNYDLTYVEYMFRQANCLICDYVTIEMKIFPANPIYIWL